MTTQIQKIDFTHSDGDGYILCRYFDAEGVEYVIGRLGKPVVRAMLETLRDAIDAEWDGLRM